MPTFLEVTTDFLTAKRASFAQSYERLRRGRTFFNGANVWYPAGNVGTFQAGAGAPALNRLYCLPFLNANPFPIRALSFRVTAGGAAGSVGRCGIYGALDVDEAYPGRLLFDSGSFDTTIVGLKEAPILMTLEPGAVYWFAVIFGTAAPTISAFAVAAPIFGLTDTYTGNFVWRPLVTFGALPAEFPPNSSLDFGLTPMICVAGV